jgi:multiple sugar transport system substrate-binding protein
MVEIEFSVMEFSAGNSKKLLPLLQAFEKEHYIHVNLVGIPWDNGWAEIAKFGIYGHGPDVSSIGSTWIASLAAMNALRAFTPQEVQALGGTQAFFDASWRLGLLPNETTSWAVPWLADTLVIYYWKDALEKAGIHPDQQDAAFATEAGILSTLEKLREAGYAYPLALTTIATPVILHEAAHWVWSAGGDFISPDNRQVIFNQPAALEGFRNYFNLRPFISPESLGAGARGHLFFAGQAAVRFAGPQIGNIDRFQHPEWNERLGIAPIPGKAFVGGSSLVIWQHSLHNQEAFKLVRFLSSQPIQIPAAPHDQGLPTRREALNMPSLENNIFHHTYMQALQSGRSFPALRLWGAVEDKLVLEISRIWTELFANPDTDLDACLHKHLDPLAQRLNVVLEN